MSLSDTPQAEKVSQPQPASACHSLFNNLSKINVERQKKAFINYQTAQQLIKLEGITTKSQFNKWSKSKRPSNFPSSPERVYKTEWNGWGVFLGTGRKREKNFMNYKEAQQLIKLEGITTKSQFNKWSKSKRPSNFPSSPGRVYKTEWNRWGAFLGTGRMDYKEAQQLMKLEGITTKSQFNEWSKSKRPSNFPSSPERVYKTEWNGWGVFLGTGRKRGKNFMNYKEAQQLIKLEGITTKSQFNEWSKSKRPSNFPSSPGRVYKTEWNGWDAFVGKEKGKKYMIYYKKGKKYMSYKKGQKHVQAIGIKTVEELLKWLKSNERPENFPPNPHKVWKLWETSYVFLKIQWLSFEEAKTSVQMESITNKSEYYELRESADLKSALPPNPAVVYASHWKGWDNFLFGDLKEDSNLEVLPDDLIEDSNLEVLPDDLIEDSNLEVSSDDLIEDSNLEVLPDDL